MLVNGRHQLVSLGFNGFPAGMPDHADLYRDRVEKYARTIHAEMNALLQMRERVTPDMRLYTWPIPPCERCLVHLIQAGLTHVIAPIPSEFHRERWGDHFVNAIQYAKECGVTYELVADPE